MRALPVPQNRRFWIPLLVIGWFLVFGVALWVERPIRTDEAPPIGWQKVDAKVIRVFNHSQPTGIVFRRMELTDNLYFDYTYSYASQEYRGEGRLSGVDTREANYPVFHNDCMTSGAYGLIAKWLDDTGVVCDVELAPALATLTAPFVVYVNPENPSESKVIGLRTRYDR